MATKLARAPATPPAADDFKLIHGIGPGVEGRLHGRGVTTFAQLAALTPAEIVALLSDLAALSSERIVKQDWIGQARELLASSQAHAPAAPESEHARQRYATFTIELLLDAEQGVRRTRLAHLQSEAEETWAGWDAARLIELIAEHAPLRLATPPEPAPDQPPIRANDATPTAAHQDTKADSIAAPLPATLAPLSLAGEQPGTHSSAAALAGTPRLQQIELCPAGAQRPYQILHHDASTDALLTLDLRAVQVPPGAALRYRASLFARPIGGTRQPVGVGQGELPAGATTHIRVPGLQLTPGTYRIEALVVLHPAGALAGDMGLSALLEGGLIQVY